MREIIFTGKRKDNGEWVEGFLIKGKKTYIVTKNAAKYMVVSVVSYMACVEFVEVIPETVGQYTGLTDKKSKKIFEGDIVSFKRVNALGYTTSRVGDVRYYNELPIFYIMATTGDAWDWVECENIEVIGNIHDNPELLEEGK